MPFGQFLGRLHPVLIHFPIALVLTALALEIRRGLGRRTAPGDGVLACLGMGALGAIAAAASGWEHAEHDGPGSAWADTLEIHRWIGISAASVITLAWFLCAARRRSEKPWLVVTYRFALGLASLLVIVGGHLGGTMVRGDDWYTAPFSEQVELPSTRTPAEIPGPDRSSPGASKPDLGAATISAAPPISFVTQVAPVLAGACYECHGPKKQKGRLRLDRLHEHLALPVEERVIQPGDAGASELMLRIRLPADHEDVMPAKGELLTAIEIGLLEDWIDAGAELGAAIDAPAAPEVGESESPTPKQPEPKPPATKPAAIPAKPKLAEPEPAKPTAEPKPAEPKPAEPKPAEPKPAEPEPGAPKPGVPAPAEPKPGDSESGGG